MTVQRDTDSEAWQAPGMPVALVLVAAAALAAGVVVRLAGASAALHVAMPIAIACALRWRLPPWGAIAAALLAAGVAAGLALAAGEAAAAAAMRGGIHLAEAAAFVAVLLAARRWQGRAHPGPAPGALREAAWLALGAVAAAAAGALLASTAGLATGMDAPRWGVATLAGFVFLLPLVPVAAEADDGASTDGLRGGLLALLALGLGVACLAWGAPYLALAFALLLPAIALGPRVTAGVGVAFALLPALHGVLPVLGVGGRAFGAHVGWTALATALAVLVALLERERRLHGFQARAARERLGLLLDRVPALVFGVGRDQRLRSANRRFEEWRGQPASELVGARLGEVFADAAGVVLAGNVARVLAGQPQQFELPLQDGRKLRVRYEPQHGPAGDIDGFLGMAEEVHAGQGEAVAPADALELLLEASPDAMLVLGADDRLHSANTRAAALLGWPRAAFPGMPLDRVLPTLSGESIALAALDHAGAPIRVDDAGLPLQARHRDGQLLDVEFVPGGEHPGLGSARACALRPAGAGGMPEARGAQHDRHRAQVILDAIGDAVVACDASLAITVFNPVAEAMTGWTREQALGRNIDEVVRLLDAGDGDRPVSPVQRALEAAAARAVEGKTVLVRRDGEHAAVEASAAPIPDEAGGHGGAVMVIRDISQSQAMALEMSHLAQHDHLTRLPNRVLLHDRLSQELAKTREGRRGALLFLDLDFFKNINDTLGHAVGDKVLQEVSRRLVDAVREDDTVSRQGGDEFVLLLVRMADPRDAARVAEKLIQAVEQPIHHEGQDLHVSASIGIALFPQDARDIKTLMIQADTALYHAKHAGRGRYSYFTGQMSERAEQRMRMEHDIRLALSHGEFFLAYQPKVSLRDGRITGMEALLRWRTSDGVLVPPAEFIPVAEETGLIVAIDEWVMREACRQNKAWQDAGLACVPVSVNVSLARFEPERLLASVRSALEGSGLAPRFLEIEFTESQMFVHQDRTQLMIEAFKALGVQLAVDDFGVGYSSLSYLVRYPFDTLKIDRSFINGLPDEGKHHAVVQAILGMAHALGYHVVAEGVETVAQADVLARQGCGDAQGFLFSRPVPAAEFEALLRRGAVPLLHGDAQAWRGEREAV